MGEVIMSGIVPQLEAPSTGIVASELAVGSSVYLMENGSAVEYLVVNQGIPSGSSLYDSSCNGLWLLRKDVYQTTTWLTTYNNYMNNYQITVLHENLNNSFFDLFDTITKEAIKQVKIPYVNGNGNATVASGANGLSTKVFLLSGYEVGWTTSSNSGFPVDGACLDYFEGTATTDSKRVAYLNGVETGWWTRSPQKGQTSYAMGVYTNGGGYKNYQTSAAYGVRPALVLPDTALFDEKTLLFKGVS